MSKSYLERDLVEGVSYLITNDVIHIQNEHTLFIHVKRDSDIIEKKDILGVYKEIYRLCKDNKVSIGRSNKYKKKIEEHYSDYKKTFEENNERFDKLIEISNRIKDRGIHYGYSDDEVMDELREVKFEVIKSHYTNTSYSIIKTIYRRLLEIKIDFENGVDFLKIYL